MFPKSQQGLSRGVVLSLLLLAVAALFFGATFLKPIGYRYTVERRARELSRQLVTGQGSERQLVNAMIDDVYADGLPRLHYTDVDIRRLEDRVTVEVWLELPYHFPWTDETRTWKTTVAATTKKAIGL
jgi:hypothetical protein